MNTIIRKLKHSVINIINSKFTATPPKTFVLLHQKKFYFTTNKRLNLLIIHNIYNKQGFIQAPTDLLLPEVKT